MAGVLGTHWASQLRGVGMSSSGQMKPARKTSGNEEMSTTWVGRSRRVNRAPSTTPSQVVASRKGRVNSHKATGSAVRAMP
ncbi:hypothetical protein D3C75_1077520 [compost metagenome]